MTQRLIAFISVIVPGRLRTRWRREWEAELEHREGLLDKWDRFDWRAKLELMRRASGAFRDALLLQPRRLENEMFQDLRFGLRMLLKNPGFAAPTIITLALGIGANTALFSIVKSVLIEPLPFSQSERLMQARLYSQSTGEMDDWVSHRDVVDWQERSQSFESIGSYRHAILDLSEDGPPEAIYGVSLSHELLPMLGVKPAIGRYFLAEEDQPGRNHVIILSDDLWRRRFGARPDIIGQTIRSNDGNYVVAGVMPPGFNFPLRLWSNLKLPSRQMGFWMAMGADPGQDNRGSASCNAVLRLKPGVQTAQAQAELDAINSQLAREYPQTNSGRMARLVSLKDQTIGGARMALLVLFGAVGLVTLIVCANITSMSLIRANGRRKELSIRLALGASRLRLARQALTESLSLAVIGAVAGVALATWLLKLLIRLGPHNIPRLSEARIDTGTLIFSLAITLFAGLFFGAVPAWRASRVDLNDALKDAVGGVSSRRRSLFAPGNLLVTFEIAIALSLTMVAGLLLNSFVRLMRVDPGFQAKNALAAIIILPRAHYPDESSNLAFFRRVIEQLEAIPGIDAAGVSNSLPLSGHGNAAYLKIEGSSQTMVDDPSMISALHIVSANYPRAIDIPLLRGRFLTAGDTADMPAVALINEAAAQRFWPGEDPIGKRFSFGQWRQVVGIVGDTHRKQLDESTGPEVYVPFEQAPKQTNFLVARSSMSRAALTDAMRRAVAAVDPQQPIFHTMPMEDLIADSTAKQRFILWTFGAFGALALSLASLGVYGVVSYAVTKRTRELGIRIALGARGIEVLKIIMSQGLKPVVIGAIAGSFVVMASRRVLSSLLYNVAPTDPATFIGSVLLILYVALLACYLPARRAMKIDPMISLRCE